MSKSDEKFKAALDGKKIPILTLDNKWHQLFTKTEPDKQLLKLQDELNELMKRQGKAGTEIKKIKALKKKLMDEIVEKADEASSGKDKKAESKIEENKRLISECNEKLEEYEDELIELPRQIDSVNKKLMLKTMDVCYDTLKRNKAEIEETAKWITAVRIELKKRLIRKQEQELLNQELYTYMHNIFGADVIDVFDMEYLNKEE
ncbi:MAG: hypothetical protein J6C64_08905 [Lachnospiraceae bacterium]|nr:hypothetical protein [Lachnospiraceae bacterium]